MHVYREYIEITDPEDGGPPYVATIRMCHDFPEIQPNGGNQVVVFDDRVPMSDECRSDEYPTDTWGVLVMS